MPKAERETKKDVTSMQQDIKRRNKTNPGTPSDVGLWEGSTDTKYRWASHLSPVFALGFINSLAVEVATSKLLIVILQLSLASSLSTKVTKILSTSSLIFGYCTLNPTIPENESLTLVDEVSTVLS